YPRLGIKHTPQESFDPHRSLIMSIFAQSVAPSVGRATISLVQFGMTNERELIPPPGFSTLIPLLSSNTSKLPPITASTFIARTPENTPLTNQMSTSNNLEPMISPAFVEANYEVLESLLRKSRKQMRNEDLRTELEYFSEEYDEERKMEPFPREPEKLHQPRKQRLRGFEDRRKELLSLKMLQTGKKIRFKGMKKEEDLWDRDLRETHKPSFLGSGGSSSLEDLPPITPMGGMFRRPPREAAFPLPGCVTPFVRWIKDYPLPDGLKMPSHCGSYKEKGDPDNFLHLFEGAIRIQQKKFTKTHLVVHIIKQKEGESTKAFVTSLVEFLSTDLPTSYKGLMEKTYTWIEAKEVTKMTPQMTAKKTPIDSREIPHGTTTEGKEIRTCFPHTVELTTDCSPTCPKSRGKSKEHVNGLREITFPPVSSTNNSFDPVIIKAWISERESRLTGSARRLLRGALLAPWGSPFGNHIRRWFPHKKEGLNFVIIRSNSPHKLLLRRTTMQRMGIVVSTVHGAIKFHTPNGIGIVLSTYEPPDKDKGKKKSKATCLETMKNVHSCVDVEERIIVNTKNHAKSEKPNMGSQPCHGKEERQKMENMAEEDKDKTAFFAGKEIRRNLEAYVDDMMIKSMSEEDMLQDIQETFDRFKLVNMKLNPKMLFWCRRRPVFRKFHNKTRNKGQPIEGQGSHRFGTTTNAKRGTWPQKTQIPKDFSIEMPSEKGKNVVTGKVDIRKEGLKLESIWKLYTDGASSSDGLGAGLMLIIHKGREYTYALCFEFKTTNNEAEYEALLAGLRIAREMEIKSLAIFTDSQLMANQIKGIFEARHPTIKQYLEKVKEILKGFDTFTIEHVRRNQNKKADALNMLASIPFEHPTKEVLVEVLEKRSINDKEVSKVEAERGEN
nr:reverse transcriptase domain-containing protein [Tanacetum cinerariifolium]